jgi:8-oxo-dGTP diphosphatase
LGTGIPQFGSLPANTPFRQRPGSYGVALGAAGDCVLVLCVEAPGGLFLPGGGAEAGEHAEDTLCRELREELGASVTVLEPLGTAGQYVLEQATGRAFNKLERFFLIELSRLNERRGEADHRPVWLPAEEALARLREEAQRWGLAQALKARPSCGRAPA